MPTKAELIAQAVKRGLVPNKTAGATMTTSELRTMLARADKHHHSMLKRFTVFLEAQVAFFLHETAAGRAPRAPRRRGGPWFGVLPYGRTARRGRGRAKR